MDGNAALASEFELPFTDRTPTEREYVCGGPDGDRPAGSERPARRRTDASFEGDAEGKATLEAVVWACVSLHNYLRASDESERGERLYCPAGYVDTDKEGHPGQTTNGRWRVESADGTALSDVGRVSSNTHATVAKSVREKYMKYFCSRRGEVPWQYNVVLRGAAPAAPNA
ncbi:hypothetical protein HPB47_010991 [Ixodes persulcatus]|uniref:Uncharacterized protein n=1 Tax=Ixodes persulcatus TaxID=34615 RepID=A0AC60NXK3_IXOPE|nr:hypothetical protein HPB47_010991 [Ixodes persulcatus]